MGVDDRVHIGASLVDLGVDEDFRRRLVGAVNEGAFRIHHDHLVSGELAHAADRWRVLGLDDDSRITSCTGVTEIVDKSQLEQDATGECNLLLNIGDAL